MEDAIRKADVLIEALPYIRKFHNKIIVIKYGGSILGDEKIRKAVLEDLVFLNYMGLRVILVHGGGPNISERMRSSGQKANFVDGIRVTDEATLKIVEEELKKLNDTIVAELKDLGGNAVSLNGKDNILISEKKLGKVDLGLVGNIVDVNIKVIKNLLEQSKIVVLLPMGSGKDAATVYNINADEAAASVSAKLDAEKLVLLTNVKGIMRNSEDPNSFFSTLTQSEVQGLMDDKIIQSGMIPKVNACIEALNRGVKKTHIVDACTSHALLLEIFTDKGIGTEIIA